jgi:RHS repeat-associated protein
VFVHDLASGATSRVSLDSAGLQGDKPSLTPKLSADGRYVAFYSTATNLVAGDTHNRGDIFVHDRLTGVTERRSLGQAGQQADNHADKPALSADGSVVAFESIASNLVAGDTNGSKDVFVRGVPYGAEEVTTYTYDGLDRLTSVAGASGSRTYAYDPLGNRLSMTREGVATTYGYDGADRLIDVDGSAVTVDAAGNMLARGSDSFSYDAANRLIAATSGGVTQSATYDGDGARVATAVGSITTNYRQDVAAGLPQVIDDGTRRYVWGPAGLAYSVEGATGAVEVVQADHLGSVRTTTDAAGSVTATARYDEFGVPLAATGSGASPFGFTGEQTDPTGLVHLRARAYDPILGRFLNRDPWPGIAALPVSLNRYTYVANNPVRHTDPAGMCGVDVIADVAFSVGSGYALLTGPDKDRVSNAFGFILDVLGIAVPCFGGGGTAFRSASHLADEAGEIMRIPRGAFAGKDAVRRAARAFGEAYEEVGGIVEELKHDAGRGPADDIVISQTGDVIAPESGEIIGNIFDELGR